MESDLGLAANLPRRPREVEWRKTSNALEIWFLRLLMPFLSLFAVALLLIALPRSLGLLFFGTTVAASMGEVTTNAPPHDAFCTISYSYPYRGRAYQGSESVKCSQCLHDNLPPRGSLIGVRALRVFGWHETRLWYPGRILGEACVPFIAVMMLGGLFKVLWDAFGIAPRQRALLEKGTATEGTLTAKRSYESLLPSRRKFSDEQEVNYLIDYSYKPLGGPIRYGTTKVQTDPKLWVNARMNARTLVFYDPENPERSVAYDFCLFRVRGFSG